MRFQGLLAVLAVSLSTACAQPTHLSFSSSLLAPGSSGANSGGPATAPAEAYTTPFSGLAIGVKFGLLGIGVEAATPLSRTLNLRGGANFFSYNDILTDDGISYNANLHFRSAEASLDWFPWAGAFHISPGALLYNGNQITANASVPGGQSFTLNNQNYVSSDTDPVTGSGSLTLNKAAPKLTVGWGNMLPRSGRHWSVPFDVGFAYVGDPKVSLKLAGTACYDYEGQDYCSDVATNAMIQSNLAAQQQKIANDAAPARFYPLVSVGLAFNF
ncbi:MAG: hypothetical protein WCC14_03375 [Acidobacteriaceae bacterium]